MLGTVGNAVSVRVGHEWPGLAAIDHPVPVDILVPVTETVVIGVPVHWISLAEVCDFTAPVVVAVLLSVFQLVTVGVGLIWVRLGLLPRPVVVRVLNAVGQPIGVAVGLARIGR